MTAKTANKEQYGEVIARLREIVDSLERGEFSLEESLEKFAEGIKLVKSGEQLLSAAEKRIEQLLADDRVQPLDGAGPPAPPAARPAGRPPTPTSTSTPTPTDDDDVPF